MKTGPRSYRRWNASIGIFHVLLYLTLTVFGFAGTTLPAREQPGEADQGASQGFEEFPLRGTEALTAKSPPEEITYRSRYVDDRGFNRLVGNIVVPTLSVYHSAPERNQGVGMVVCPGGGYGKVVIDTEGHALARYFQKQGITVAVLKYRMPQPVVTGDSLPLSQENALEAVQFMRRHAAEWRLDENHIGILGCSAGGHLAGSAAILGSAVTGSRPDFAVLLYPVVLMDGPFVHAGSRRNLLGPTPTAERRAQFLSKNR